ncbi:hypothetical protein NNRS527_01732 [Nitrosospira sp. NRS527]|nr:hypothetical protein NNRS527_01732 [Nitrosospira sp. NRS527]
MPAPQTPRQQEFEVRIQEVGMRVAKRLGISRRIFLQTAAGVATAFLASCLFRADPRFGAQPDRTLVRHTDRKQIRRRTHRSTRQLEDAIRNYLKLNDAGQKPFVGTKSAYKIMDSIECFCPRIYNSGH